VRTGRLLRTSTFRRALIYMAPFGVLVVILFGFLYLGTLGLIDAQANATIEAEIRGLAEQYSSRGLSRLTEVITERSGSKGEKGSIYLLTGPDLTPLAGNLNGWPSEAVLKGGWLSFEVERNEHGVTTKHEIRAKPFRLEGGFRLLVGRDMAERAAFQQVIAKTLALALVITIILGVSGALYLSSSSASRRSRRRAAPSCAAISRGACRSPAAATSSTTSRPA
jgi:hypothetical protein